MHGVVEAAGEGVGEEELVLLRCSGCHGRVDGSGTVMLWLDLFSPWLTCTFFRLIFSSGPCSAPPPFFYILYKTTTSNQDEMILFGVISENMPRKF